MVTKQKFAEERKAIIKANTWLKKILPRTNFNSAILFDFPNENSILRELMVVAMRTHERAIK